MACLSEPPAAPAEADLDRRIEAAGGLDEEEARALVARLQAAEGVDRTWAHAVLVRGLLGRAVRLCDGVVARLGDRAPLDEVRLLDRAVGAIARAAETYDPARGPFLRWADALVWQAVWKHAGRAARAAWTRVPLETAAPGSAAAGRDAVRVAAPGSAAPGRDAVRVADPAEVDWDACAPRTPTIPDRLIDVPEAAALLRVSERTLYKWIARGRLRPVRLGRMIRFLPAEIERLMRDRTTPPAAAPLAAAA